jgi:hypothetical protein
MKCLAKLGFQNFLTPFLNSLFVILYPSLFLLLIVLQVNQQQRYHAAQSLINMF